MQTHQTLAPQYRLLVFLVSIGFFMQGLDTTIINTALPAMAESLHINPLRMHNVVISYVLAVAAFIPLSGWLADRFGIRHVYIAAIVIFSLGSLGCALSTNLNALIAFRVLQGIGGALLMPVGRLALLKLIPREQFLSAMSMMSLAGLIGPLIGPSLGGWLVQFATWHWIFLINIPMGILGIFVSIKAMPNLRELKVKNFDFSGFVLLMLAMVGLALAIEQVANPETTFMLSLTLFLLGGIASLCYVYHAHTHKNALFRSHLFKHQIFTLGILGNFFVRLGSNAIPFLVPLMLQVAFHMEPLMTGIMMTPMVLGSLFSKPIIRPLMQKMGYRPFLIINSVLLGLCIASFALTSADTPTILRALHFFIFGILNSLQFVSMNTLTLKDLPQQDASSGNSFLSMIMMLSMSIGVALAGTLLNFFSAIFTTSGPDVAFQLAFISMGIINVIATWIFWKLPQERLS